METEFATVVLLFATYTKGTELGIARQVTNQDGMKSCWRVACKYNPENMRSTLARRIQVLQFDFRPESELLIRLTSFEMAIEQREDCR